MFDYILFDLDGTLTDPFEGITKSIIYAMESFGIKPPPAEELTCFIGPPVYDQFKSYCGLDDEQTTRITAKFRERYETVGYKECTAAYGAKELLERLKAAGKVLAVATSKVERMAAPVLEYVGLAEYFDFIGGAQENPHGRNLKQQVIEYVLESINAADKRPKTVMIGDRFYDVEGAKKAGIRSIGVLTGFGTRGELEKCGADFIAESLTDAAKFI